MSDANEKTRDAGDGRSVLTDALHLVTLTAFAVAQPLFDVLGREATFFVAHRTSTLDLVLLALVLAVLAPLPLILVELLVGLISAKLRRGLHGVFVAAVVALVLLPPAKPVLDGTGALLPAVALGGLLAAFAYSRLAPVRTFLTILSPASLVFAALFLMNPSITKVMQHGRGFSPSGYLADTSTSIVMVVLDELPLASLLDGELEIDGRLFPNFARLAADSTWFRNASSNHSFTEHALPSMLSGKNPTEDIHTLPIAADHPDNLFSLFAASHRMNIWETFTGFWIPPDEELTRPPLGERMSSLLDDVLLVYGHMVLPAERAAELPSVTTNWAGFGGGEAPAASVHETDETGDTAAAEDAEPKRGDNILPLVGDQDFTDRTAVVRGFIASLDASEEPTLSFLHTLLPHGAWERLPTGELYPYRTAVPGNMLPGPYAHGWNDQIWLTAQAYQRHLLQLGHVDRLLGELLERLETLGVYERTLVVLLSDHGCTFVNGVHKRRADEASIRDILHIPLFVKAPFQKEGRVVERNVSLIDVLPTLAEAAGADVPWAVDGVSGFETAGPERPEKQIYSTRRLAFTLPAAFPEDWPTVERKLTLFAGAGSWDDVYGLSPSPELVGRALSELEVDAPLNARLELFEGWMYDTLETAAPALPAFVQGDIVTEPGVAMPAEVAVAVNGRVYGGTVPYDPGEQTARFGVIVPPEAFVDGRNAVELFAVLPGPRLAPIPGPVVETYEQRGEQIVRSDGHIFEIRPGALKSRVDRAELHKGGLNLTGWGANLSAGRPAEAVVVFLEGELSVFDGPMNRERSANARKLGGKTMSGFGYRIPVGLLGGDLTGRLRVYVLEGELATELEYGPKGAWLRRE
jgi:hypothetical protein